MLLFWFFYGFAAKKPKQKGVWGYAPMGNKRELHAHGEPGSHTRPQVTPVERRGITISALPK
jgi:hypothetical protein